MLHTAAMAILPITIYPAQILQQRANAVANITDEIRTVLNDMAMTMYAAPGVGLAGPQVNVGLRICVIDVGEPVPLTEDDNNDGNPRTPKLYQLINPAIVASAGHTCWNEGCLSLPDLLVDMERHAHVVVNAMTPDEKPITIGAHGLLAVALQHEIDHLDGKLIIDHVGRIKRGLYLSKLKKRETNG